jgi:hypothetical protein
MAHPVGRILTAAAKGVFPEPDGSVQVVAPWHPRVDGVVSLTGRAYVATNRPEREVLSHELDGYGSAVDPRFIAWLAGPHGWCDCLDAVLVSAGTGAGGPPRRPDLMNHPRARHARLLRSDVEVYGDGRGLITLGQGVGGLAELGVEVANQGSGRSLIRDSLGLVGAGQPVLASVAPGNARALRAFLAAGFTPIASVQLVRPAGR